MTNFKLIQSLKIADIQRTRFTTDKHTNKHEMDASRFQKKELKVYKEGIVNSGHPMVYKMMMIMKDHEKLVQYNGPFKNELHLFWFILKRMEGRKVN